MKLSALPLLVLVGLASSSPWALAQTDSVQVRSLTPPQKFVQGVADQTIRFLKRNPSQSAMNKQIGSLLDKNFDLPLMARSALGRHWSQATDQQKQEYIQLFKQTTVGTCGAAFRQYSGQIFQIVNEIPMKRQGVMVKSRLNSASGALPLELDWIVRTDDNRCCVIDVNINGVSVSRAQSAEYNSIITNNGDSIEALLKVLRQRVGASRASSSN